MKETSEKVPFEGKAYQIASGVFRFGDFLPHKALGDAFKAQAVRFLDAILSNEYGKAGSALRGIQHLARFGGENGIIQKTDAALLIDVAKRNIEELGRKIEGSQKTFDLQKELTMNLPAILPHTQLSIRQSGNQSGKEDTAKILLPTSLPDRKDEDRNKVIVERIRQSGNARLKDIQEALPDIGERMLRYILQSLIQEGRIERVGNGGVGNYYRLPTAAPAAPGKL